MKLLADSGSTKCDWVLISASGKEYFKTIGLNPNIISSIEFIDTLKACKELEKQVNTITEIHFYGAGCSNTTNQEKVKNILSSHFKQASTIKVSSDLLAAANATCGTNKGYVAILGTGSNMGYFDGTNMHFSTPSLGFLLGDEGSGNAIGKELLKDYFYGKMPEEYRAQLNWKDEITKLYQSSSPNAYLASKVKETVFMHESIYFKSIVKEQLRRFFALHKMVLIEENIPVHFIGSIAYIFKSSIQEYCIKEGIRTGKFIQSPILGLS